ncbi:MAG: J domain-containing protein [Prochlorotrichaceae cyanobacterium]
MLPSVNYYQVLGVKTNASDAEIRQAYRNLSKQYHPDTTRFPNPIAQQKFLEVKTAYEVLINPEQRSSYDLQRRYAQNVRRYLARAQMTSALAKVPKPRPLSSSAYLEPHERPLSAGEVFALFILGLTLLGCILLAIALGLARGQVLIDPPPQL